MQPDGTSIEHGGIKDALMLENARVLSNDSVLPTFLSPYPKLFLLVVAAVNTTLRVH